MHSRTGHYMEMRGQLPIQGSFTFGKTGSIPTGQKARWTPQQREKIPTHQESHPGHPVQIQSHYELCYPSLTVNGKPHNNSTYEAFSGDK
jgi:hypothetical protein